jgi:hypothetical protein
MILGLRLNLFDVKKEWTLLLVVFGGVLGCMDGYTCFQLQSVCNPGANGKTLLFELLRVLLVIPSYSG